jgi:hypothetical protein
MEPCQQQPCAACVMVQYWTPSLAVHSVPDVPLLTSANGCVGCGGGRPGCKQQPVEAQSHQLLWS